jgi:molybdopterin-containing oxidoreductase family iron-sulfur binding subunit
MFYVYSNDTSDYFKCKKEGREVVDGEFQTAFKCLLMEQWLWDVNDKGSEIKKLADDERMYHLLSMLNKPM